jgi:intracellular septation protein A
MFITQGSLTKTAEHTFKLIYFQSDAIDPPDKLLVNGKEYIIKPGLEVKIGKGDVYQIISIDPNSYRIYNRVRVFSVPSIVSSMGALSSLQTNAVYNISQWNRFFLFPNSVGTIFFKQIISICWYFINYLIYKNTTAFFFSHQILTLVFLFFSVYFINDSIFKVYFTINHILIAVFLYFWEYFNKTFLIKLILNESLILNNNQWKLLNKRYIILYIGLALLNEIIWRTQIEDLWFIFTLLSFLILNTIFIFLNILSFNDNTTISIFNTFKAVYIKFMLLY